MRTIKDKIRGLSNHSGLIAVKEVLSDISEGNSKAIDTNKTEITELIASSITAAAVPDASTTVKGKVQLAGDLSGTSASPTITNTAVISKVLTGYSSVAAAVAVTDSILGAIGKLNGNTELKANLASPIFTGTATFSSDIKVNGVTVGRGSGASDTNTVVGHLAFSNGATGGGNSTIGAQSLIAATTAVNNTTIGALSLQQVTTGSSNVSVGASTGAGITTGSGNTILGANVTGLAPALTNNIILSDGTGTIRARYEGAWYFSGSLNAAGYNTVSDLRYKDIISRTPSSDGIDMILYTWKKELNIDTLIHYGYVAQEVEIIYPDQVSTNKEGYKAVNYIEVLVSKNQELEKRIKALEEFIRNK